MKKLNIIITALFCLLLTACGSDEFEGEYTMAGGLQKFQFKSDGKVTQFLMGKEVAKYKYEKNGSEIKIYINEDTSQILTVQDNGNLLGAGIEFIKVTSKVTNKVTSKVTEIPSAPEPRYIMAGKNYISKPDPAFKAEYATTTKLFFRSDNQVKLFMRYYDTGAFRENEKIFQYKVNGNKVILSIKNGPTLTLSILKNGTLVDDQKTEFILFND